MELNDLRRVIDSLHNLARDLKVIENTSEEMRKEITTLIDVYENSFFDMIMKGMGKDE
jgi:hypothetical protein